MHLLYVLHGETKLETWRGKKRTVKESEARDDVTYNTLKKTHAQRSSKLLA